MEGYGKIAVDMSTSTTEIWRRNRCVTLNATTTTTTTTTNNNNNCNLWFPRCEVLTVVLLKI
jgi:hypothetical protein